MKILIESRPPKVERLPWEEPEEEYPDEGKICNVVDGND